MVQDPRFKIQDQKSLSELRFDLASGDWVVIATGRAKRPESFKKEKREKASSRKPMSLLRFKESGNADAGFLRQ